MGCNIHAHYEIKVDGQWIYYAPALFGRNYDLYSRLAGVRSEDSYSEPLSKPRGLPTDISQTTKLDREYYGPDGHSDSWISSFEYTKIIKEYDPQHLQKYTTNYGEPGLIYLYGNSFEGWIEYPKDYPNFIQDFRLVFWFDN